MNASVAPTKPELGLSPRVERARNALRRGQIVVSCEPLELLRARRRGRLAIDAHMVATRLIAAESEFFAPEGL